MNLKTIILKSVATTMAISIVFGNISVSGIGISKAIAENSNTPDISIELENEKYVQYKEESYTGVAVHSKLSIYSNQTKDNYLPTKGVELEVNLPTLNGCLPEKAIVAEGKTKATTGEEMNTRINQNYDISSGLLTISYENIPNDEGQIYSDFKENVKDEFEIIYIYPEQAYIGNDEEVKLVYTVNAKMTYKTQDGTVTSQNTKKIELTEKENKSDILEFRVTDLEEEIYKGFLYSNVENKTSYDTEYKTVSTLCVLNNQVVNELTMELKASEFVLNDENETKIASNGKIVYKATGISKYEFDKILGQEGYIEFYLEEEAIAKVNYVEVDEKGTQKLAVIYLNGTTSVLNDEDTSVIVEYPENLDNLKIKVSKPIKEGFIHFENQNVIKASEDYGCKIEDIKYIRTQGVVNNYIYIADMPISETETKISVTSSNSNFSTLQNSKTTITVKLDDTNASTKLFNNPIITIKLPEGLKYAEISSPRIINGNGLEVESATVDKQNRSIIVKLSGKQTNYDLKNITGGVNLVMDLEKIDYDDTLPTHSSKIEVTCIQGKEETKTSQSVNIVSKAGLLMLSKLSNYDNSNNVLTIIDNSMQTVEIDSESDAKEVVYTLNLVNNYDEDLTNVQIIGRIGYSVEKVSSNFETKLTKAIEVSDSNAKVYYSNNKEANIEDDSWTEQFSSEAKSYKVVINNNKIDKSGNLEIKEYVQIPANLGYNKLTFLTSKVTYTYKGQTESNIHEIKLQTPIKEENENIQNSSKISITLATREEGYIQGVIYGVNSTIEYRVKVKNNTNEDLNNLNVQYDIPSYFTYTEGGLGKYDEFEGYSIIDAGKLNNNIFEYTINKLKANEEKDIIIRSKVQRLPDNTYQAYVTSVVKVNYKDEIYKSNENTIQITQAAYEISMQSDIKNDEILKPGDSVIFTIKVKNVGKRTGALKIIDVIPDQIEPDSVEYDDISLDMMDQNIEITQSLEAGEVLNIKITGHVKELESENEEIINVENIATLVDNELTVSSNTVSIKIRPNIIEKPDNPEQPEQPEQPDNPEQPEQPEQPDNPDVPDNPTEPNNPDDNNNEQKVYSISGIAWIDENKNGKKDENEKLQDSVIVSLVNKETGNFALDASGNRITTITDSNGKYTFANLSEGTYIVLFEFDTNTYTVTTYQKTGIEENLNSDAILSTVTIDGNKKLVGITDNILLEKDKENIDIGLITNPVFDLSLDKKITKITVSNSKGTEVTEYEDGDTAKIDLVAKYMNTAKVIVNYKFTVTNNGDITGYVNSLVDNLPSGLEFSSELNTNWYKGSDGKLYTTSLSGTAIKPGESAEIELVLTKNMTEENTGTFPNNAKLEKISNLENIMEKDTALENNESSAILIISIKTGSAIMYFGITVACIAIIGIGIYLIKKKVLNKGI